MRIIHRISIREIPRRRQQLEALGIKVPKGISLPGDSESLVCLEVAEDHQNWPHVQELVKKWNGLDTITTRFSPNELGSAEWLQANPTWHCGYPQPEEDSFGYLTVTYDLSSYCSRCGIGARQISPFRMKCEPKWGSNHLLQLNWVFDEFFAQPGVWKKIFEPFGVSSQCVHTSDGSRVLESVVQLCLSGDSVPLEIENSPSEVCRTCGRRKYLPIAFGKFPSMAAHPNSAVAWSQEWFGSGASAWHAVLFSKGLFSLISQNKLKGVSFVPLL